MPSACLMRLVLSTLSSLSAAASCGPALGHLGLVQHSAKFQHSLEQRVASASGAQERGIWDVMTKIKELGHRLTGAAPEQGVQAEAAHAQTSNERKMVNSSDRDALRRERREWRRRQEAKALARNASWQDMTAQANNSETAPAQGDKAESVPASTANLQQGVNSSSGRQGPEANASARNASEHHTADVGNNTAAAAAQGNQTDSDALQANNSGTAPAQGEKVESAPASTAQMQQNSSSDRQGPEANASARNASKHHTADVGTSTAAAAAQGKQTEMAQAPTADVQNVNTSSEREELRRQRRLWRRRQEAKALARNASEQESLVAGNMSTTSS